MTGVGSSSKTAQIEDEMAKMVGSSSKSAKIEDEMAQKYEFILKNGQK